jgi:hypothetical protein
MPKPRYDLDGEPWVPISKAAKLLGTNVSGVRKLIEEGKLRSRQSRAGSSIIIVALVQIADLRSEREQWRKEREPRKPKVAKSAPFGLLAPKGQRVPGHREQMALPMTDAGKSPSWRRPK